jgi:hypothetical protein
MKLSVTARWILLALAGLLVAVAVAVAASKVTSQRIGLASEPLQAGQELAPGPPQADQGSGGRPRRRGGNRDPDQDNGSPSPPATTTAASTTTTSATTGSDDSASESIESEGADD